MAAPISPRRLYRSKYAATPVQPVVPSSTLGAPFAPRRMYRSKYDVPAAPVAPVVTAPVPVPLSVPPPPLRVAPPSTPATFGGNDALDKWIPDSARSLMKGAIGISEGAVGLGDIARALNPANLGARAASAMGFGETPDYTLGGALEKYAGYRPQEAKEIISSFDSPELQAARAEVEAADGFMPTIAASLRNPSTIVQGAIESAPTMIGAGGVARGAMKIAPRLAPIVASAFGEGAVTAGQGAEQTRQATGTLTPEQAAIAVSAGAVTAAISRIAGQAAKALRIADPDTLLAGAKSVADRNIAARVVGGMVTEGLLEELPQSAQEQFLSNVAAGKPWLEGVPEAAAAGALTGAAMGGVVNAPGPIRGRQTPPQVVEAQPEVGFGEGQPDDFAASLAGEAPVAAPVAPIAPARPRPQPSVNRDLAQLVLDADQRGVSAQKALESAGMAPKDAAAELKRIRQTLPEVPKARGVDAREDKKARDLAAAREREDFETAAASFDQDPLARQRAATPQETEAYLAEAQAAVEAADAERRAAEEADARTLAPRVEAQRNLEEQAFRPLLDRVQEAKTEAERNFDDQTMAPKLTEAERLRADRERVSRAGGPAFRLEPLMAAAVKADSIKPLVDAGVPGSPSQLRKMLEKAKSDAKPALSERVEGGPEVASPVDVEQIAPVDSGVANDRGQSREVPKKAGAVTERVNTVFGADQGLPAPDARPGVGDRNVLGSQDGGGALGDGPVSGVNADVELLKRDEGIRAPNAVPVVSNQPAHRESGKEVHAESVPDSVVAEYRAEIESRVREIQRSEPNLPRRVIAQRVNAEFSTDNRLGRGREALGRRIVDDVLKKQKNPSTTKEGTDERDVPVKLAQSVDLERDFDEEMDRIEKTAAAFDAVEKRLRERFGATVEEPSKRASTPAEVDRLYKQDTRFTGSPGMETESDIEQQLTETLAKNAARDSRGGRVQGEPPIGVQNEARAEEGPVAVVGAEDTANVAGSQRPIVPAGGDTLVADQAAQGAESLPPTTALAKATALFVQIGDRRFEVESFEDASNRMRGAFDAALKSGKNFEAKNATIVDENGKEVARVSSNGRVWPPTKWEPGTKPLYDPAVAEEPPSWLPAWRKSFIKGKFVTTGVLRELAKSYGEPITPEIDAALDASVGSIETYKGEVIFNNAGNKPWPKAAKDFYLRLLRRARVSDVDAKAIESGPSEQAPKAEVQDTATVPVERPKPKLKSVETKTEPTKHEMIVELLGPKPSDYSAQMRHADRKRAYEAMPLIDVKAALEKKRSDKAGRERNARIESLKAQKKESGALTPDEMEELTGLQDDAYDARLDADIDARTSRLEKIKREIGLSDAKIAQAKENLEKAKEVQSNAKGKRDKEKLQKRIDVLDKAHDDARRAGWELRDERLKIEGDPAQKLIAGKRFDQVDEKALTPIVREAVVANPRAKDFTKAQLEAAIKSFASNEWTPFYGAVIDKGLEKAVDNSLDVKLGEIVQAKALDEIKQMEGLDERTGYGQMDRFKYREEVKRAYRAAEIEKIMERAREDNKKGLDKKAEDARVEAQQAELEQKRVESLKAPVPAAQVEIIKKLTVGEYNALKEGVSPDSPFRMAAEYPSEQILKRLGARGLVEKQLDPLTKTEEYVGTLTPAGQDLAKAVQRYDQRLKNGIPFAERGATKSRFADAFDAGDKLIVGKANGKDIHSSGRWLVEGAKPAQAEKYDATEFPSASLEKTMAPRKKAEAIRPVAYFENDRGEYIVMSNGSVFNARYFDYVASVQPGSTFESNEGEKETPVYFKKGGRYVGVVMPIRYEPPPGAQAILDGKGSINETPTEAEKPKETKYDFSSTQANLPEPAKEMHRGLTYMVAEDDLAGDGRETDPHVTVKYGLHTNDAAVVRKILADEGPVRITFGDLSTFPPSDSSDGAEVLKIDIDSPDLRRLNKKISDALPHTDTFKYAPHVTVAYVKPGEAKKYVGRPHILKGKTITLNTVTFSGKDGEQHEIPLAAEKPKSEANGKIQDVGEKIGGARKDLAKKTGPREKGEAAEEDAEPWRKRFSVGEVVSSGEDKGKWVVRSAADKSPFSRALGTFDSKAAAEAFVPIAAVAEKHRVYQGSDGRWKIERKIGDRKLVQVIEQTFESRDAAMAYMVANAETILEVKTNFGEEVLPRPDPNNVVRVGKARRTGDVDDNSFKDTFGFRGVEFGNWNAQDERQTVMNQAYDALLDLAETLGIPSKAISLNGDLALAFGSRGQGLTGARAHYEPKYGVINLTKMSGAGALAHEWLHAVDHYFARQDGKAVAEREVQADGTRVYPIKGDTHASVGFGYKSKVRAEVQAKFKALMEAISVKAEQYVEDTEKVTKWLQATKDELEAALNAIRSALAKPSEWDLKSKRRAATSEELMAFDALAEQILNGEALTLEFKARDSKKSRFASSYRWTNEALEGISAILKKARKSGGFAEGGILETLAQRMKRYSERLATVKDAQAKTEKTKLIPTDFARNARQADQGRVKDYWRTPWEMSARAFEAYVNDRLSDNAARTDFLTYGTKNAVIPTPWGLVRPYPMGAEREAINKAFDDLFKTIQTKETDKGVAMFERRDEELTEAEWDNYNGLKAEDRTEKYREAVKKQTQIVGAPRGVGIVDFEGDAPKALLDRMARTSAGFADRALKAATMLSKASGVDVRFGGFTPAGNFHAVNVGGKVFVNYLATHQMADGKAKAQGISYEMAFSETMANVLIHEAAHYAEAGHDEAFHAEEKRILDSLGKYTYQAIVRDFAKHASDRRAETQKQFEQALPGWREGEARGREAAAVDAGAKTDDRGSSRLPDGRAGPESEGDQGGPRLARRGTGSEGGLRDVAGVQEPAGGEAADVRGADGRLDQSALIAFARGVEKRHGLERFDLLADGDDIVLAVMVTPRENRSQGRGSAAMRDLLAFADEKGKRIIVTPARRGDLEGVGPTSYRRTESFYERFGFVKNKGANRDETVNGEMYRKPSTTDGRLAPGDPRRDENFRKWFGDSKVVDADGKPLVVYHGTTRTVRSFVPKARPESGRYEPAVFFTDSPFGASAYAEDPVSERKNPKPNVVPVYIKMENPRTVDFEGRLDLGDDIDAEIENAREFGNDGLIIENADDGHGGHTQFVVWNPTQIKSAIGNRGTFDPKNPDIRFSRKPPAPIPDKPKPKGEIKKRLGAVLKSLPEAEADLLTGLYDRFAEDGTGPVTWESIDKDALATLGVFTKARMEALKAKGVDFDAPGFRAAVRMVAEAQAKNNSTRRTLEAAGMKPRTREYRAHIASSAKLAGWILAMNGEQQAAARAFAVAESAMAEKDNAESALETLFGEVGGLSRKQAAEVVEISRNNPKDLPEVLGRAFRPGFFDWVNEWRKGAMLFSLRTYGVNFFGNAMKQALSLAEIPLAAATDRATNKGERQVYSGELGAAAAGLADYGRAAFRDFLTETGQALKGVETFDPEAQRPYEQRGPVIPGPIGKFIRTPFRMLQAADNFFKKTAEAQSLYREAFRRASNQGLKGDALWKRVDELISIGKESEWKDPRVAGMQARATKDSRYETFTLPANYENAGGFGALADFLGKFERKVPILGPVAGLAVPFKNTPANIAYQSFERSPFGFFAARKQALDLRDLYRSLNAAKGDEKAAIQSQIDAKQRELSNQVARATIGTTLFAFAAALAAAGLLTGSGPPDWEKKKVWEEAGNLPNAINLGGTWYGYDRFEPLAASLAIAGNVPTVWNAEGGLDKAAAFAAAMKDAWIAKTYFQGLEDFSDLIKDPARYGANFLRDTAGSFVPAFSGQTVEDFDPIVRDRKAGLMAPITSRIPGLSQDLPAVHTGRGDFAKRTERAGQGIVPAALNPLGAIRSKSAQGDSLAAEMSKAGYASRAHANYLEIGVGPKGAKRKERIELTETEREAFRRADEAVSERFRARVINTPGWKNLDPNQKLAVFRKEYDRASAKVRDAILPAAARRLRDKLNAEKK